MTVIMQRYYTLKLFLCKVLIFNILPLINILMYLSFNTY